MEFSLADLTIDDNLLVLVELGMPLTEKQLAAIDEKLEEEDYAAIFLKVIDKPHALKALSKHGQLASKTVLKGVTLESLAREILTASKEHLSLATEGKPLEFYLNLCATTSLRYPKTASIVLQNFFDLLASENEDVRETALLALLLSAKQKSAEGFQTLANLFNSVFDQLEISDSAYTLAYTLFEYAFALFPAQTKEVYMSDKCKQATLARVAQLQLGKSEKDLNLAERILIAASLSCGVDEHARKFNMDNYLEFFIAGTELASHPTIVSLSLLCLVKIWNFSAIELRISLQSVIEQILATFRNCEVEDKCTGYSVEALAYLSLGALCKKHLRSDEELLEKCLLILETQTSGTQFIAILFIFENLTQLKNKATLQDESTVNFLKAYSLPKSNQVEDDDETIRLFNSLVVKNLKLVGTLKALKLKDDMQVLAISVLHNLADNSDRSIELEIVAQGGLTMLLNYLAQNSTVKKGLEKTRALNTKEETLTVRVKALRALAFLCWPVNPKLLVSEFDLVTVVPFLVELFGPEVLEQAKAPAENDASAALSPHLNFLDKLYALLALTNVCSSQEETIVNAVVRRTFDQYLRDLMIDVSEIPDIQKATWELIGNCAGSPSLLAKFFNVENAQSIKNLKVLVNLLHSKNTELQVVVAGFLANSIMAGPLICEALMSEKAQVRDKLLNILGDIYENQVEDEPLIVRVTAVLQGLLMMTMMQMPAEYKKIKDHKKFQEGLRKGDLKVRNTTCKSCTANLIQCMKQGL